MTEELEDLDVSEATTADPRRFSTVLAWVVTVPVLLLYVWAVINAVGNLIGMRGMAQSLGADLTVTGWGWLVGGVVLPIAVAFVSFVIARKQPGKRWLTLLVGLAVVAVMQLNIQHLVPQSSFLGL